MYIPCSSPLGLLSFFLMSTLISVYLGRRNQNTANMCSVCYSLRTSCTGDNSEIRTNLDTSNSRIVQPIVTPILETDDDSELDKIDVGPFAVGEPEIKELNKRDEQCLLNRCYTCNKRTGFTGFRCRCEYIFCSSHRHSNKHNCTFDYKALGRDAVAKANPAVIAEKLHKVRLNISFFSCTLFNKSGSTQI